MSNLWQGDSINSHSNPLFGKGERERGKIEILLSAHIDTNTGSSDHSYFE